MIATARLGVLSVLLGELAACSSQPAPAPEPAAAIEAPKPASASAIPRSAVTAASAAIWKEPRVRDFNYRPNQVAQWIVAVDDDGSPRFGYAGYICLLLSEHGIDLSRQVVRVTDIEAQRRHGEDFRSASLGAVRCADEGRLDDAPAARSGA